jgi:putative restriction endonuclease
MRLKFKIGDTYTRDGIQDLLRVPARQRSGNWNTGYTRLNGQVYVFCNIGIAGRTGHDYPNRWNRGELIWFGKNGSKMGQPLMKAMISGGVPVHVFWRTQEYGPFTYAGTGQAVDVRDTSPVGVC